jgi:hypothetical protein
MRPFSLQRWALKKARLSLRHTVKSAPDGQSQFMLAYRTSEDTNFRFVRRYRPFATRQSHLNTTPAKRHLD